MSESQAKIRLTLDGQQAIRETERLGKGMDGVADRLSRAVLRVGAVVQGLKMAVDAAGQLNEKLANNGRSSGKTALSFDTFAASRKLNGVQYRTIQEKLTGGAKTEAEGVSFLQGLDKHIKPELMTGLLSAHQSGLYTDAELKEFTKRRRAPSEADIYKRGGMLSREGRDELDLQIFDADTERTAGLKAQTGPNRLMDARAAALVKRRKDTAGLGDSLNMMFTPDAILNAEARKALDSRDWGAKFFGEWGKGNETGNVLVYREWLDQQRKTAEATARLAGSNDKPQIGAQQ